jgi:hypothetical protein
MREYRMQLSGPWPPYHFVHRLTRGVHCHPPPQAAALPLAEAVPAAMSALPLQVSIPEAIPTLA